MNSNVIAYKNDWKILQFVIYVHMIFDNAYNLITRNY